jgi:hypothetical protein
VRIEFTYARSPEYFRAQMIFKAASRVPRSWLAERHWLITEQALMSWTDLSSSRVPWASVNAAWATPAAFMFQYPEYMFDVPMEPLTAPQRTTLYDFVAARRLPATPMSRTPPRLRDRVWVVTRDTLGYDDNGVEHRWTWAAIESGRVTRREYRFRLVGGRDLIIPRTALTPDQATTLHAKFV